MDSKTVLLILLSTYVFVSLVTPLVIKLSIALGAVDMPNERKVHAGIIPRMGGLGIYLSFLISYFIFGGFNQESIAIIIASVIIITAGMADDISGIRPRTKFLAQLVAAIIVVFYGNVTFESFKVLGFTINLSFFGYFIAIFWIVSIINAINLIDGLDGLAGGISAIYFFTIAIITLYSPNPNYYKATLSLIMLGSTLGFLMHNFHPAKTFMGDTGSLFLGLMVAVIPLSNFDKVTLISLFVPLFILIVPAADIVFAIIRRIIKKVPISQADKDHIHHQFLNMRLGHMKTVLIIYLITIVFSVVAIIYSLVNVTIGKVLFLLLSVSIIYFVEHTSILTEDFKPIATIRRLLFSKKSKPLEEK